MKTLLALNRLLIVVFLLLFVQSEKTGIEAQQPKETGITPVMKIVNQNTDGFSVRLDMLAVDIQVVGQIAITTLDMTFVNPNKNVLEGEFNFPLGNGLTVSRFALDIGGELREGVVVEKEKGRATFEAIARKKIDPGLLEMTEGNNFRARVFPLPSNGYRRIVIAFEQELPDDGISDLYQLPLMISEPVRKFSIHAEIIKNRVGLSESNKFGNLNFKQWNNSYLADFKQDNYVPDEMISLEFPHQRNQPAVYTACRDIHSSWFYVNLRPELITEYKDLPGKITLLWDNSNSASNRHIDRELDLLDLYFKKIQNLSVELITFNITCERSRIFEIHNGNWESLRSIIENQIYDGGTSFQVLNTSHFECEEILIVTDGLGNMGSFPVTKPGKPVYAINSSPIADHSFLTCITQLSGGAYVDLSSLEKGDAIKFLENSTSHFISWSVKDGNAIDIFPSGPRQISKNFSLAGILIGKSATLTLNFGTGSTITDTKTIMITADSTAEPEVLRRVWAEKKIAELSLVPEHNKNEITSLGKKFGIVTPNTSLLVLETLEDYIRYEIVPPEEMQAEYFRVINLNSKSKSDQIRQHFERVLDLYSDQSRWWKTVFPEKTAKQKKDTVLFVEEAIAMEAMVVVDQNAPPPPPPPQAESNHMEMREEARYAAPQISDKEDSENQNTVIQINSWDPETPYLKVLEYALEGREYITYLKLKQEYGNTPSFYLDAADFFASKGKLDTAVRILSNLAELKLEVPQLLRAMGKKLLTWKQYDAAISIFQKVVDLRPEEPQSFRDLGLAYEAAGKPAEALHELYKVINKDWDGRFPEIELIVLNEINHIIASSPATDHSFIDQRLIKREPVDVRVVLTWDTDNCDMDLWVTSPSGEKCFYEHTRTVQGGKISSDFTGGYGPEEFMIKKAQTGIYTVHVNYFGTSSNSVLAPVNLHVAFFTNYGKPNEQKQEVVLRLMNQKDVVEVGQFRFSK